MQIILGSTSKRRYEIMKMLSVPFSVVSPNFNESLVSFDGSAEQYVSSLAQKKGLSLTKKNPDAWIITADTTVLIQNTVLNKPKTLLEAKEMLMQLSGQIHEVFTATALTKNGKTEAVVDKALIKFYQIDESTMDAYIQKENVLDKAGAYGIQGLGSVLVEKLTGSFFTVMGMCPKTVFELFNHVGIDLWKT